MGTVGAPARYIFYFIVIEFGWPQTLFHYFLVFFSFILTQKSSFYNFRSAECQLFPCEWQLKIRKRLIIRRQANFQLIITAIICGGCVRKPSVKRIWKHNHSNPTLFGFENMTVKWYDKKVHCTRNQRFRLPFVCARGVPMPCRHNMLLMVYGFL